VRAAIERGALDVARVKNHAKMMRELRRAESVEDMKARRRRKLDLRRAGRRSRRT
jgi:hypothetical protein